VASIGRFFSTIFLSSLSEKPIDYAEKVGDAVLHYSPDKESVLVEIFAASTIFKDLVREARARLFATA
jgi:hypothetical protein